MRLVNGIVPGEVHAAIENGFEIALSQLFGFALAGYQSIAKQTVPIAASGCVRRPRERSDQRSVERKVIDLDEFVAGVQEMREMCGKPLNKIAATPFLRHPGFGPRRAMQHSAQPRVLTAPNVGARIFR